MISQGDLNRWFGYHPANDAKKAKYAQIEDKARELADLMVQLCPANSTDTRHAITRLREAKMMAVASIACDLQ